MERQLIHRPHSSREDRDAMSGEVEELSMNNGNSSDPLLQLGRYGKGVSGGGTGTHSYRLGPWGVRAVEV